MRVHCLSTGNDMTNGVHYTRCARKTICGDAPVFISGILYYGPVIPSLCPVGVFTLIAPAAFAKDRQIYLTDRLLLCVLLFVSSALIFLLNCTTISCVLSRVLVR